MSNNYYVYSNSLIPGDDARAEDVASECQGMQSGFDLLPTPRPGGDGFSEPFFVADGTDPGHAANFGQLQTLEESASDSAAAALISQDAAEAAEATTLAYRNTTLTYRNEAEDFKNQAEIAAAAAGAAAGLPSLTGKALNKLSVNAAEDGVEWTPEASIVNTYTTSTTWNKAAGATFVFVECWGGGGGGGSVTTNNSGDQACGGGGGEYTSYLFKATSAPSSATVTVGAAGTGGASGSANNGSNGGNSQVSGFSPVIIARGGIGGQGGSDASQSVALPPLSARDRVSFSDAGANIRISHAGRGGADNVPSPSNAGGGSIYGGGGGGGASGAGVGGTSTYAGNGGAGNASSGVKGGNGGFPSGGGGGSRANGGGGDGGAGRVRITQW